jgi:hypothetical protein
VECAPKYAIERHRRGHRHVQDAAKWLRKRGWESIQDLDAKDRVLRQQHPSKPVWVAIDSPEWLAWEKYFELTDRSQLKAGGKLLAIMSREYKSAGRYLPSLWPPKIPSVD